MLLHHVSQPKIGYNLNVQQKEADQPNCAASLQPPEKALHKLSWNNSSGTSAVWGLP